MPTPTPAGNVTLTAESTGPSPSHGSNSTERLRETEASALRQEILADAAQSLELTKFALVATTAFIGFALTAKSCLIALLPILVLAASRGEIINRKGNTLRISTYLRAFGGSTTRYEDRLWHLRKLNQKSALHGWSGHPFGTFQLLKLGGYASVGGFSLLLYVTPFENLPMSPAFGAFSTWLVSTVIAALGWFILTRWQDGRLTQMVEHGALEEELHRRWLKADMQIADEEEKHLDRS